MAPEVVMWVLHVARPIVQAGVEGLLFEEEAHLTAIEVVVEVDQIVKIKLLLCQQLHLLPLHRSLWLRQVQTTRILQGETLGTWRSVESIIPAQRHSHLLSCIEALP